jgi:hypothetical protein
MPEEPKPPEPKNPEDEGREEADTPSYLLHERLLNTIDAFMAEYDGLSLAEVVGVLEAVKFDYMREWSCCGDVCCDEDDDAQP